MDSVKICMHYGNYRNSILYEHNLSKSKWSMMMLETASDQFMEAFIHQVNIM